MLTDPTAAVARRGPLLGWRGHVSVRVPGGPVLASFPNLLTDAGLDLLVGALLGQNATLGYLAVGTGTTPPAPGDVQLDAETARYPVTSRTRTGTGRVVTRAYLTGAQALGEIREVGWFAGTGAGTARGTGVLIARVLYDHTKGDRESLVIDRTDTIGRA